MNSPPDPPIEPGQTVSELPAPVRKIGQYDLYEQIGKGGMGVVWKGRHRHLGQLVAVKLLLPGAWTDERAVSRFYREMRAGGQVLNEHVVRAVDAGEYGGEHVLVMEYVDGQTLGSLLSEAGPYPVAMACEAIRQAALGVAAIHRHGMTHRDLKPSNLFLTRDGCVKVLDLGLARLPVAEEAGDRPDEDLTHTGLLLGTIDYMAPEQTRDARAVDHRTDLYSLGCTLYALLAGNPPFRGQADALEDRLRVQREVVPDPLTCAVPYVPAELSDLVQQLLAKQPEDRIQTAEELVKRLEKFSRGADLKAWQASLRKSLSTAGSHPLDTENQSSRPVTAADVDTSQVTGESNTWSGLQEADSSAGLQVTDLPQTVISSAHQSLAGSSASPPAPVPLSASSPGTGTRSVWLRSGPLFAMAVLLLAATAAVPLLGRAFSLVSPEPAPADGLENDTSAPGAAAALVPAGSTPPLPETAPEEEGATVQTVQLQDLTDAAPLRLHPLLAREPVPLFWQNSEGLATWKWEEDLEQVHLSSDDTGLLAFGMTAADDYQLQVGLHQNRWVSGAGVFVGLEGWDPAEPDAEWSGYWFQLVERASSTGNSQWEVRLSQLISRLDSRGYRQVLPTEFAGEPVAPVPYGEATLEITVTRGRLMRVRFNNQSLRELVAAANSLPDSPSWHGAFGAMINSGDVMVRNCRYMSTSGHP